MKRISSFRETETRYKTLRITASFFSLVGSALLAIAAMLFCIGLHGLLTSSAGTDPGFANPGAIGRVGALPIFPWMVGTFAFLWSFGLMISGVQFLATGSLLRLLIHLEENTRATAQSLDRIRMRLEPKEEEIGPFFPT